jgi:hypothetical protein
MRPNRRLLCLWLAGLFLLPPAAGCKKEEPRLRVKDDPDQQLEPARPGRAEVRGREAGPRAPGPGKPLRPGKACGPRGVGRS